SATRSGRCRRRRPPVPARSRRCCAGSTSRSASPSCRWPTAPSSSSRKPGRCWRAGEAVTTGITSGRAWPAARAAPRETAWPALAGYLFLLPWLIGFFGLTFGPALASLVLSFTDFDLLREPRWIGADNYLRIATDDPKFTASMHVTLAYVGLAVPLR